MKKAGITEYIPFIEEVTSKISDLPFSFEIFADELDKMEYQIKKISEFGQNIYVKVPITNTKGESTVPLIEKMSSEGIKINVTAVFTKNQVESLFKDLISTKTPLIVSIFAGRIADTGVNPCPLIEETSNLIGPTGFIKTLWASTRTIYNVYEAQKSKCDIITVTPDLIPKLKLKDKNLDDFSLETVKMFYNDAISVGYKL
jgi:transaldolase